MIQPLSGFRLMWMMVLYDLPVVEQKDRKAAVAFHDFLLDQGFLMAQFSVYIKFVVGSDACETIKSSIQRNLPPNGTVDLLVFTDKQYENIVRFDGRIKQKKNKNPEQLLLL